MTRNLALILAVGTLVCRLDPALAQTPGFDLYQPASGRVVIVEDPGALVAFEPQPPVINRMVRRGLEMVAGGTGSKSSWYSLISTQDVLGIKVYSKPGTLGGTRPAVVAAVVQSLLEAGHLPDRILIWDKRLADLQQAGFGELALRFGVRLGGSLEAGYDEKVFYSTALLGKLVWGDREFGKQGEDIGRNSYVSKLVTQEMTKIVNITPLLNHNLAGVSGNLYGLAMGSVDNVLRFEAADRLPTAIPEIYALPELGDRVVLNIVDALTGQYEGEDQLRLQYATVLGQLRFSTDPVALDVLSLLELQRLRKSGPTEVSKAQLGIYSNASLLELGISDPARIHVLRIGGTGPRLDRTEAR